MKLKYKKSNMKFKGIITLGIVLLILCSITACSATSIYIHDGVENVTIDEMHKNPDSGIGGYEGFITIKEDNRVIMLYQADMDAINKVSNGHPEGTQISVIIKHDDFEQDWNGQNVYYFEYIADKNGEIIS